MENTQLYRVILGYMGFIWGLYRDNGKEHANYYLGFRVYSVLG